MYLRGARYESCGMHMIYIVLSKFGMRRNIMMAIRLENDGPRYNSLEPSPQPNQQVRSWLWAGLETIIYAQVYRHSRSRDPAQHSSAVITTHNNGMEFESMQAL